MIVLYDIETDGLLREYSRVHCIALQRLGIDDDPLLFALEDVPKAVSILTSPEVSKRVAHNGLGFDAFVLEDLYEDFVITDGVDIDTLVISRLIYGDRLMSGTNPGHSLDAWGKRLGQYKGSFGKTHGQTWHTYSQEMGDYCVQDVRVQKAIWDKFNEGPYMELFEEPIELEHKVRRIVTRQEITGVRLDVPKALAYACELTEDVSKMEDHLIDTFGLIVKEGKEFTPKRDNKRLGYKAGCVCQKIEFVQFNPGSRQHIAAKLKGLGWEPTEFTPTGLPEVNEKILKALPWDEAKMLAKYLDKKKMLGMVETGKNGWLKLVTNEKRIHGRVNTLGAGTGRMTHSQPNLAQVPKGRSRQFFIPTPGWVLVGQDAAQLELRCLAHYLGRWDGGQYSDQIEGTICPSCGSHAITKVTTEDRDCLTCGHSFKPDIHTFNQNAAGLPTRDNAKTFIYGWLYGAGAGKIGEIVGKGPREGNKLKRKFMKNIPAVAQLKRLIDRALEKRKYLKAIDGRHISIRSKHSALNFLLQGAGAIIMKYHLVNLEALIDESKARFVLNIHDEIQTEVRKEYVEEFCRLSHVAAELTTQQLNLKCPFVVDPQVGSSWAETH